MFNSIKDGLEKYVYCLGDYTGKFWTFNLK